MLGYYKTAGYVKYIKLPCEYVNGHGSIHCGRQYALGIQKRAVIQMLQVKPSGK